jgi:hypothetical protein
MRRSHPINPPDAPLNEPRRPQVEALSRPSTLIELEPSLVSAFRREAAKRDVSLDRLVHDRLDVIASDGLVTAILDD